ncbi:MAG: hypothetical protein H3C48_19020 [Chitinophagaceae bacterium]|nr:hypothetical protein [Chitinophagaceae bacterium]
MKQISINLYQFAELSEEAKHTALDSMRDTNIDYEWWDFVYDDFSTLCKYIGIETDTHKMFFRGFYLQGDGSSFAASVDLMKLVNGIRNQSWKEYAPDLQIDLEPCPLQNRMLSLIERGFIDSYIRIKNANRETSVSLEADFNYSYNKCDEYINIDIELDRLETWLDDTAHTLNHHFYKQLQHEYEYLTSDEAVRETIEVNEYEFTHDGQPADCLLKLQNQ